VNLQTQTKLITSAGLLSARYAEHARNKPKGAIGFVIIAYAISAAFLAKFGREAFSSRNHQRQTGGRGRTITPMRQTPLTTMRPKPIAIPS